METVKSYKIIGIDYGKLSRLIEERAHFSPTGTWETYVSAIIGALEESKNELVNSSIDTCLYLKRGFPPLGYDHPTDIIWSMSILFLFRTLAMLEAKSRDKNRSVSNRKAHLEILETYIDIILNLCKNKEKFAQPITV